MTTKYKLVSLTKVVSQSSMDFNVLRLSVSGVDTESYKYMQLGTSYEIIPQLNVKIAFYQMPYMVLFFQGEMERVCPNQIFQTLKHRHCWQLLAHIVVVSTVYLLLDSIG